MSFELTLILSLFGGSILLVLLAVELGNRFGLMMHRRTATEADTPISTVMTAILTLFAFILAFTFEVAANRFNDRKELVRDEANKIRAAWSRSDFLPEQDRLETQQLVKDYLRTAIGAAQSPDDARASVLRLEQIHARMWDIAVVNARTDMNSDVFALYIESLNEVASVNALRVAIGLQTRLPVVIWLALAGLTLSSMVVVGYQAGIAGSRGTKMTPVLALAVGVVIALIGALDRPVVGLTVVSQQPLIDLLSAMDRSAGHAELRLR